MEKPHLKRINGMGIMAASKKPRRLIAQAPVIPMSTVE